MEHLNVDELFSIAIQLDLPDILSLCKSSKRFNQLVCLRDRIWLALLERDFPDYQKLNIISSPRENYKLLYQLYQLKQKLNLPEDVYQLYNLKELNLDNNQIK